jgi:hypothetical protein
MRRINLTIEKLVLRGFEPADRTALVEGLQEELLRMLAVPPNRVTSALSRRTPVLKLDPMPFSLGPSGSRNFGTSVAQAIGKGLKL